MENGQGILNVACEMPRQVMVTENSWNIISKTDDLSGSIEDHSKQGWH